MPDLMRNVLTALALGGLPAHAGPGTILPGQDFATSARPALQAACTNLILTDNATSHLITCDLPGGDLITANAALGGVVYWVTYRTPAPMERAAFVDQTLAALGLSGAGAPCLLNRSAAECWERGSETLHIPLARDPAGRWMAVHEDPARIP